MNNKVNPRVTRTQQAIYQAFIALLYEKPFEEISVQKILQRSTVNRNTFYRYFSSKEVLAGVMLAEFKARYAPLLLQRFDNKIHLPQFLQAAASQIFEERHTLLALLKIQTPQLNLKQDIEWMLKKHFIDYAQSSSAQQPTDGWQYQAELFAQMIMTTLLYHLSRHLPLPTETVFQQWRQIADLMEV